MTRPTGRERPRRGLGEFEPPGVPAFLCEACGRVVPGSAPGTRHRNHCPHCLASIHVDVRPGDRRSGCREVMEAIAVWVKRDGEWAIVHRCRRCGKIGTNRIAGDDNEVALVSLAVRPLAAPPFPLHDLGTRVSEQLQPKS